MFDILDHNEADIIITLDNHSYNKDYIMLIYHKNKWNSRSLKTVIEYIKENEFSV